MSKTATGALHSLDYIAEVTYGTTPATPAFSDVRHNGTTLALEKGQFESKESRADRQIAHHRHGVRSVTGDINAELSYGTFDDLLEAVLCGTWATNVLKAGTTRRSFTFERYFGGIATPEYHRFTGVEVNTLSMTIKPEAVVECSFGCIGQDSSIGTAIITGATYGAATTTEPFDAFTGSILEGGGAIGTVTSLDFTLENNIKPLPVVGSALTIDPVIGASRITGNLGVYFQNKTLLEKFINETASAITVTLTDAAGNDYTIDFSNVKYTGGSLPTEGDGEITLTLPFIALYDATDASQIVITRAPA